MADLLTPMHRVVVGAIVGDFVCNLLDEIGVTESGTPQDRYETLVAIYEYQLEVSHKAYAMALEKLNDDSTPIG